MNSENPISIASELEPSIWYCDGMKTTIDRAGRVVIPVAIRSKAGLKPGTELEVLLDDFSVRLVRSVPGPKRIRRGRRWIFRPSVKPEDGVDVEALVEEERSRWPW